MCFGGSEVAQRSFLDSVGDRVDPALKYETEPTCARALTVTAGRFAVVRHAALRSRPCRLFATLDGGVSEVRDEFVGRRVQATALGDRRATAAATAELRGDAVDNFACLDLS